ncbi:hypothetical protein [Actinomycetospora cinnamomea]|uniref:Uncharacterized protein n=1 Tax=Actinomycetospora cinnamomea TaxID=663609 RepID=A0A2U1FG06_9PSEU|nr:hypothetical protein [Actinomycetospora cinnamomea]PVZ11087.1 hypothetical protein C8D89_104301 [Actinomycetospora cinnamomea]
MALPVSPDPTDRRAAVVRLLTASPEGLSDAALARALGGPEAGVRPQTVNHLCRRMAAAGELERVGTRPILNRLPARPGRRRRRTKGAAVEAVPSVPEPDAGTPAAAGPVPAEPAVAAPEPDTPVAEASAAPTPPSAEPSSPSPRTTLRLPKHPPKAIATAPRRQEGPTCGPPPYDALQAWSRVVNVQALVASWLVRRGATLRSASLDEGPARDLVASLDGDDVHVEVTGWPADGARTHPTTIAGDWFSAAEQAAAERRRAHPRARIVIALPDTRRYRSLTEQRSASLAGARAEVWFVDAAGAVHAR